MTPATGLNSAAGADAPAIELRGVDKRFGAVHANRSVDLIVRRGVIHGIVGENGAGKSTLMSILFGFYEADKGTILVNGKEVSIRSSADAIRQGIGMVHQHFMLVDTFTVVENVMLGAEKTALIRREIGSAREALREIAAEYRLEVDPDALVGDLPVGARQRVEILKALYRDADILILDEPTGVLTPGEADDLFRILRALRARGKTVILITHKLREIMAVSDRVSVMRRGRMVAHLDTRDTGPEQMSELMVGRKVVLRQEKSARKAGAPVLTVENLSVVCSQGVERVKSVGFQVRAGEIVGIAGVSGNGQSELLEALAGILKPASGTIDVAGERLFPDPRFGVDMVRSRRIAHVPEDRHRMGLVTKFAARESAILGYQDEALYQKRGFLNWLSITRDTMAKMVSFDVRPLDPMLKAANMSGGNQQKLILAREIERDPRLLLIGQPTRGVDIGAIEFIHKRLLALREAGDAILLVSAELDEIMALSDRILVMFDGRILGEVDAEHADERTLGLLMAGCAAEAGRGAAS